MANRAKVPEIVELLRRRISAGDYNLSNLPGRRVLASQLGVSPVTAMRAVETLLESGHLDRSDTGRLVLGEPNGKQTGPFHVAFLCPAFDSEVIASWRREVERVVTARGGVVRAIGFVGWHDPVLMEALEGNFKGAFLIPPSEMPQVFLDRLHQLRHRTVTLWQDLTRLEVPCVTHGNNHFFGKMIEHLVSLGHRRIDCINTQPVTRTQNRRIDRWRQALDEHGVDGMLHDHPVKPFGDALAQTYRVATDLFKSPSFNATAILCTTMYDCISILRAAHEAGIRIGKDLSLCAPDNAPLGRMMVPSVTSLDPPSAEPLLARALDWIFTGGQDWQGGLLIEHKDIPLFKGDSSGPAPTRR